MDSDSRRAFTCAPVSQPQQCLGPVRGRNRGARGAAAAAAAAASQASSGSPSSSAHGSRASSTGSSSSSTKQLDALLNESILLSVLLYLESDDATRLGACCSGLQVAIRAPRLELLWRRWFERSSFVLWPFQGVCGPGCLAEVDRDGFFLTHRRARGPPHVQQLQHLDPHHAQSSGTGYMRPQHEGWGCQLEWNARTWDRWQRGLCSCSTLPTDSYKVYAVSVHPRAVCVTPRIASLQDDRAHNSYFAAREGADSEEERAPGPRPAQAQPTAVLFSPGAGRKVLQHRRRHPIMLAATSDRVLSYAFTSAAAEARPPGCQRRPQRETVSVSAHVAAAAASPSLQGAHAGAGAAGWFAVETLEQELESLAAGGGGGRRGSGKNRRSGQQRQQAPAAAAARAAAAAAGGRRASAEEGGVPRQGRSGRQRPPVPQSEEPQATWPQQAHWGGAAGAGMTLESVQVCRCTARGGWLGCSLDAASGLMVCCLPAEESSGSGILSSSSGGSGRKKGAAGGGAADACEYRMYDLLSETELAQLAVEGRTVHSLLLNFVYSGDGRLIFAFDRWHREFFVWSLGHVFPGEPLEAAAAINAHTEGILALDVAGGAGACSVLCGSRDETVSLYRVDPVVRLATFHGHQAEVSAVCWLRGGDGQLTAATTEPQPEQGSAGGVPVFASGSYDGHIKLWDAREGDAKCLPGLGLTLLEHQNRITRLASVWDGRILVSGDVGGVVKTWDLRNCAESLMTAQFNGAILDLRANRAFSVARASPQRGRDSVHILSFGGSAARPPTAPHLFYA